MSNIMKGIVDEGEEVAVIYIDGKPSAKYAKKHEAERDAEFMRKRHPNKKIEIKHEVRETEAKKGADGKRCWKGKRYAGTENGKDKCIPVKEGVIVGHDAKDPEVAILGGAGTMSLSRLKNKAHGEAMQLVDDIAMGKFKASAYNVKQLVNTLNTIAAAEEEMEKLYFGEDTDMRYAAEKTPETNPYGGQPDIQHRGAISETPTDNPTGASGEGGWRRTDKPELNETKMSDIVNPLVKQFNLENGGDGRWPLYGASGSPRRWRRGDGSYYTDPNKIISLSDNKGLQKEFFKWLTQQPGVTPAGKIRGEFASSDYSDAVKYKGLIFIDRGAYTEYTTPSRLRNSSVWHQKTDEDTAYAGGMGQGGNAGQSYRKFKPKSAGTYKESSIMKGLRK